MHVDAVLVVRVHVFEIVGEAKRGREFVPCLRIEVCVGATGVDCIVPKAKVCKTGGS